MKRTIILAIAIAAALVRVPAAQRGGPPPAPVAPQAAAPIDLTGYWVAIVNEEWRWRMVTPPKGDYASVPLNAEGTRTADTWTPAMDGRCEAYGAAALMRMPTRVHITWQDDRTLKVETDAGTQTRLLRFTDAQASGPATPSDRGQAGSGQGERTLQGYSVANWEFPGGGRGGGGRGGPAGAGGRGCPRFGTLKVVTTNLRPGWLRRNGVPYSEGAVVTEYYDRFKSTNGDEWFFVTTVVNDPKYLQQEFVTSSHFKKEPDGSKWAPSACKTT